GGFILLHGNLETIAFLFEFGKRLASVIRWNYVWAFSFNTIFIPFAALGKLSPLAAMLLMFLSSTAVLLNSMRFGSIERG
ncbi:MAG: cation-translocating P-type ATPase, partial [Deltaproteobacteria bacterium]|nr:cation-translocating P-type ATPase [Deltaproteobacteria bacterium]